MPGPITAVKFQPSPINSNLLEVVAAVAGVPGGVAGQEAEDEQADEEDDNDINGDFKGQHGTAPKGLYRDEGSAKRSASRPRVRRNPNVALGQTLSP